MIRSLQRQKAKKGFTMIELIVVIAIIGVMMAMILPSLSTERARIDEAKSTARDFYAAIQTTMSHFSTYDGQLSPAYQTENNLGQIRYYPLMGGNYPFDKDYPLANTDEEYPAITSMYIMVHAWNDIIEDVAVVTRAENNDTFGNGMFQLLKRTPDDRNTEFCKLLAGEIDNRITFRDGWYYARVDFNYDLSIVGLPEDINLNSVKVAYTAYSRKELPQATGSFDDFVNSTLTFGSDYKLNWGGGEICGTCAAWDTANSTQVGFEGTTLT